LILHSIVPKRLEVQLLECFAIICVLALAIVLPYGIKNSTKDKQRRIEKRAKALGLDLTFDR